MIIDTHVHVYPQEIIRDWEKIAEKEPYFGLLARSKVHKWATIEDVVTRMEEDKIDQSWIFGFAFEDMGLCRACNDYVIEGIKKYPHILQGLSAVHPFGQGVVKEVERCKDAGMIGVGELFPLGQNFHVDDMRQTWRIAGLVDELDMFLLLHSAEPVGHEYPGKGTTGPGEAASFCMNHPEVRVVFAHWGGGLWLYELMPEMKRYLQNAWYDTAATPWLYTHEIFDSARSAGVMDKILYGSDFPILSWKRYDTILQQTNLDVTDMEKLLSKNALNLLQPRC